MKTISNKNSENLKNIVEKEVYSLKNVDRLADLSLNTVVKVELNQCPNPILETTQKFAMALCVPLDDLVKG
jgi:hypothetical protein